mgnify:FL=1
MYPRWFKFSKLVNRKSRISYSFVKDLIFGGNSTQVDERVIVEEIEGQKVGFLKNYNDVSYAADVSTYIWSRNSILNRVKYVFFIPTKHRVYYELDSNIPLQILTEGYRKLGVPVIDLTPTLKFEAKLKLESGEFIYWRDDTHWNGMGISAAANFIGNLLQVSMDK